MPGFFDNLFGDDETARFFGGSRQPQPTVVDAPNVLPVSDVTPASSGAAPNILTYPNGDRVIDINTGQPYPRSDRLSMQNNIATEQIIVASSFANSAPHAKIAYEAIF